MFQPVKTEALDWLMPVIFQGILVVSELTSVWLFLAEFGDLVTQELSDDQPTSGIAASLWSSWYWLGVHRNLVCPMELHIRVL